MIFIGDTHGISPLIELIRQKNLVDETLIHVGDLGLGFNDIGRDILNLMTLDDHLEDRNLTLYVVRGNHDCPIFWDKSKGLNLPKFHHLHLVEDYTVKDIEGKKVLFVGGAISIDRSIRKDDKPYPTWWKDEVFVYDHLKFEEVMTKHQNIDIVVTHTAPDFCYPINDDVDIVNYYHRIESQHGKNLKGELKKERMEVTELFNDLTLHYKKTPTHWFYGHFHSSKLSIKQGITYKLLNINETYEIPQNNNQVSEN